jgi:hypothetical protein
LSALPSTDGAVKTADRSGKFLEVRRSLKSFFEIFEKGIDRSAPILLVGTLSPIGKLFEIYFVRLIGTPNQQFNIVSKM